MLRMLADLVLPVPCAACGGVDGPLCPVCARHALHTEPMFVPAEVRPGGDAPAVCVAAGPYRGALRSALIAYKERGRRTLARPLGGRLAAAVEVAAVRGARLLLVPVPSSAAAIRERGGDHVVRLARFAAATLRQRGLRADTATLLTMCRVPSDSVGLGAAARRANISGAFAPASHAGRRMRGPHGSLRGRTTIVLVDDIVTTGATLAESYRAVADIGLPVAGAAVVAATPPRSATVYAVRDVK
ncbi:ComF family protein [Cryptosporangium sp. NPDC048952]|uniref:ComF family protein n=1 Tax=Cryptosporangium sp. NPDC048952 TaxID=3363961 RepID=UPI003719237C